MRKVGLMLGTFDPVHFGHISLSVQMSELHRLDEVIFYPAFCSPFKKDHPPLAGGKDRIQMIRSVVQEIPHFSVSDREIKYNRIVYTVDLVKEILKEEKEIRLYTLFSEDSLNGFSKWKDVNELIRLASPLIGSRSGSCLTVSSSLKEKLKSGFTKTRMMDISSTEIRRRLKKNLYCGHLVPAKVLDYITVHQLYL